MRNRIFLILALSAIMTSLQGQDKPSPLVLNAYVSNMQSAMFEKIDGDWALDNIIHNRLNFRYYAGSSITFGLEMRNRFFSGDMLRLDPEYAKRLNMDPGFIDLSTNIFQGNSFLLNNTIDRFWVDISAGKVQLKIGRQRINWGQTFVWNPNDIFNAYSYFDFDYVEKPGSDAVRLQIFPNYSSTIEFAVKMDDEDDITAGSMYRFNKWGYDIQLLAAYVNSEDIVGGLGWSGAFGSTSFRGEFSWFQPAVNFSDTSGTGLFTVGFDRSFSNSGMIQFQLMYCNNPLNFSDFESFYSGNLSAKDLAFSEFSVFGNTTIPLSPLFNIGLSAIWYPGLDGFFAGPTIDVSIAENLDFSFIWQHFNADLGDERVKMNISFLRIKYSF